MDTLNDEVDHLLNLKEDRKIAALLDVEQVNWLVEMKLGAAAPAGDMETNGTVRERCSDELAGMIQDEAKFKVAEKDGGELEQILRQLRAKFMAENGVSVDTNSMRP